MNQLENLLYGGVSETSVTPSIYQHGCYFILKHDTNDEAAVRDQFKRIFSIAFHLIRGVKVVESSHSSTPRQPLEKDIRNSNKKHYPLMVSTIQEVNGCLLSHHYVFGTHWSLNSEKDDRFGADLKTALVNQVPTVSSNGKSFLIQPVGGDDQQNDRPSQETILSYITNVDVEEENLIRYMRDICKQGMKFALYYDTVITK